MEEVCHYRRSGDFGKRGKNTSTFDISLSLMTFHDWKIATSMSCSYVDKGRLLSKLEKHACKCVCG